MHRLPKDVRRTKTLIDAVTKVQRQTGFGSPGRTRMFGTVMSVADIAERIGLEQDTNLNHSRRILLLQESASAYADDLHARLLKAVLERYLVNYPEPKRGVPRFLLNDLVRYWRTIAVDYQAKQWESLEPNWGLRYIKLLVSRKLAFAGTLASLLLTEVAEVDYFVEQFQMPALARLAQLEPHLEADRKPDLAMVLETADAFVGLLEEESFRSEAKRVEAPFNIPADSEFAKIRERAKEMQIALERVFFKTSVLGERSIRYLSF